MPINQRRVDGPDLELSTAVKLGHEPQLICNLLSSSGLCFKRSLSVDTRKLPYVRQ